MIDVTINGERQPTPDGLSLSGLLSHLGVPADRVAVERNRRIVPKADWDGTLVEPGDEVEIVHFVGGGAH